MAGCVFVTSDIHADAGKECCHVRLAPPSPCKELSQTCRLTILFVMSCRQRTPPSDEKDDLVLALRLSSDDFDKEVSHLHSKRYPPTGEDHPTTPPVEDNECDLELALTLPQPPAVLFDEQAMELNRRKEGRPSMKGTPALSHTAISPSEVRT